MDISLGFYIKTVLKTYNIIQKYIILRRIILYYFNSFKNVHGFVFVIRRLS